MSPYVTRYKWFLLLFLIGVVYASALRADDGDVPPRTIVAVTTSLDGKPLASGRIFFHLPKDQFVGAKIKAGKCQLDYVPAGTHKVTIESKGMPKRFSSFEQAALVVKIVPGNNRFTFVLTSD